MPIDLTKLRRADVVRTLNSTSLGSVCNSRQIDRLAQAAGWSVGDGQSIHLVALIAWLAQCRHDEAASEALSESRSARDRRRRHERRKSAEEADIGELPDIRNPVRRRACGESLHLFLATYFPQTTGATLFSADHVSVIDRIEAALLHGGRFVNAVYRGFGKTTITENAALWASLYGYRRYIAIFGAEKSAAKGIIASITHELCENDLLCEDFPEVCLPFRALDGRSQRAASQTHAGVLTHLLMHSESIVLPRIVLPNGEQSRASGCIIRSKSLMAARGLKFKRPDGANARPEFVLLDDIQTDESARNPSQVNKRLSLIRRAVLKSAGHSRAIAAVANVTVIEHDDLVEQLLDPIRNPAWDGVRIKMVQRWADAHDTLWQEYARIRRNFDRAIPGAATRAARAATQFYRERREAMDAGMQVSWRTCFDPEIELSAEQHAYNLLFDDPPEVFASECQNEPVKELPSGFEMADSSDLARKTNGYARGVVPSQSVQLTAFIDVHADVLYWMVVAWRSDCSGFVVDYGTFPDQRRAYFAKRQASATLRRKYPGKGTEAAVVLGLTALVDQLCGREWKREDGSTGRIAKCLIDCGWQPTEVEIVCRKSAHAAVLQPSRGAAVRAKQKPISEYARKPGWLIGDNWYIQPGTNRALRQLRLNTSHWKAWVHTRLVTDLADPGSITLFGGPDEDHRLIADHLTAEKATEVSAEGRSVLEFDCPPGRDNHWFDCLVGNAVAANALGLKLVDRASPESTTQTRRQRAIEAAKKRGLA